MGWPHSKAEHQPLDQYSNSLGPKRRGEGTRLRWAEHLMRMKEEEIPRRMITLQLRGQRGRGRPRLRWIDGVNGDGMVRTRNWTRANGGSFLRRPSLVNELLRH
ncbi:hypothetical protein C0J52_22709 [Blattella germanica]|nr:hypothetical protein C0J52_22709 [Blattella germanica]